MWLSGPIHPKPQPIFVTEQARARLINTATMHSSPPPTQVHPVGRVRHWREGTKFVMTPAAASVGAL